MNISYAFLLSLLLLSTSVAAGPRHPSRRQAASTSIRVPAQYASLLNARTLQLTCYFTDMLRLSHRQAAEVRQATLLELAQQSKLATSGIVPIAQQYNMTMLRILTPNQYSTFRWLADRQPVANLLIRTVTEPGQD